MWHLSIDKQADNLLPQQIVDIVKTHSKLAVASSWIPIPGADLAAGAASIWEMYLRINKKIDVPFGENIIQVKTSSRQSVRESPQTSQATLPYLA